MYCWLGTYFTDWAPAEHQRADFAVAPAVLLGCVQVGGEPGASKGLRAPPPVAGGYPAAVPPQRQPQAGALVLLHSHYVTGADEARLLFEGPARELKAHLSMFASGAHIQNWQQTAPGRLPHSTQFGGGSSGAHSFKCSLPAAVARSSAAADLVADASAGIALAAPSSSGSLQHMGCPLLPAAEASAIISVNLAACELPPPAQQLPGAAGALPAQLPIQEPVKEAEGEGMLLPGGAANASRLSMEASSTAQQGGEAQAAACQPPPAQPAHEQQQQLQQPEGEPDPMAKAIRATLIAYSRRRKAQHQVLHVHLHSNVQPTYWQV